METATMIRMADFLKGPYAARPAVLADLDGCFISGETALPDVPALFETCGPRLWIVSNNSTETAEGLSRRLEVLGLNIPASRIILAGEETLRLIALETPAARIALFAATPLQELARELGLAMDKKSADTVVLARDIGIDYAALEQIAALLHLGANLRITNPDCSHPGPDGLPVPETGSLLAAVAAMVQIGPVACLGKPAPDLIRKTLARASVLPAAAVFIGDTPQTDGAAAAAAGVKFIHIAPPVPAYRTAAQTGNAKC